MGDIDITTIDQPKSPAAEAYKTLRTNIQFSSYDNEVKTIVVTSATPGEGKTTTAVNLAVTFAQGGSKTILIDCDLRKPMVHKIFNLSNQFGLSNLLIGDIEFEEAIKKTPVERLSVLTSGTKPPNSSDLLASLKMQSFLSLIKEKYDYIIIDTPPITILTDAQILSKYSDGCIIVVASGRTDKEAAIRSKHLLQNVNARILGVVLNKLNIPKNNYYDYYY